MTATSPAALAALPRFPLATLPTPLEHAPRLSQLLGINLYVKREDLTGLALGGNKARKLEYLLGDAMAESATLLLTTAAAQSNFCRMTAAAGCRAGIRVGLLLRGSPAQPLEANLLLDHLLGAELRFVADADPYAPIHFDLLTAWAEEERARGGHPYLIFLHHGSRAGALAAAGYVGVATELHEQCAAQACRPDHLYIAVGSGGSYAGLLLGARESWHALQRTRVVGVCVGALSPVVAPQLTQTLATTGALLGLPVPHEQFELDDAQRGPAYGVPTPAALDAIALAARTEALLLNSVYTGKAFAALLRDVQDGVVKPGETVIFMNTGGDPLLFRHAAPTEPDVGSDSAAPP